MIKRITILLIVLCLIIVTMHSQEYNWNAIYCDTVRIESPCMVNIGGIGFLTEKSDLDFKNPKKVLSDPNTYVTTCSFLPVNRCITMNCKNLYLSIGARTSRFLSSQNLHFLYEPDFIYRGTKKGCEIYTSSEDNMLILVFMIKVKTINNVLNPICEWSVKPTKEMLRKRLIKSKYPELEYVRAAIPILSLDKLPQNIQSSHGR